mmetsp:Transcript_25964/g.49245  ORF Transcript_25964/g.49245 Transcript_25964/m.49245 type:complete len:83 (+) Transcript_25964:297-545(+)
MRPKRFHFLHLGFGYDTNTLLSPMPCIIAVFISLFPFLMQETQQSSLSLGRDRLWTRTLALTAAARGRFGTGIFDGKFRSTL